MLTYILPGFSGVLLNSHFMNTVKQIPLEIQQKILLTPNPYGTLDSPCWVWTGDLTQNGHGCFTFEGELKLVHRVVYRHLVGDHFGLVFDWRCRNKACCNPTHLRKVSHNENVRNGGRCPAGHEYTSENTYQCAGLKFCKQCRSESREKRQV